jgi:hypothetical protein
MTTNTSNSAGMGTGMAVTPAPALVVVSGAIVVMRLFDIAYAVDLARAESLWAGRKTRGRLSATPPKAVSFGVAPLTVSLDPVALTLGDGLCAAEVTARLFDFGVVSLALRVPASGLAWPGFVALLNAVHAAADADAELWGGILDQLRAVVAPALRRPIAAAPVEDYALGVVHAFDSRPNAAELLARADLVPLLSGEQRALSEQARADLLRQRFSYYDDDLVVLTWDRAFIYEPRGDSDVADVIEIANAQLVEMRYYDELLDDELPRMYDLVEHTRRGFNVFAARRYATLARGLYTMVAEVTELTEKVDNALQVTEDVYLARIYAAALDVFRVRLVSAAVERKLAIIRDTYTALYDEASGARSELMEIAVIVLILVEVLLALLRHAA